MNILLVSQCSKKAIPITTQIIDQFAERTGDRVWQTMITMDGMKTLKKLLSKYARKNTAIACHWLKGKNSSELLWIVGNKRRFNVRGIVATNATNRDVLRLADENSWHTVEIISILSSIAGLFHDIGKANNIFQKKLKDSKENHGEGFRHEWISLRLFEAFVGGENNKSWLERLAQISANDEERILNRLTKDSNTTENNRNPFLSMSASPLAQIIGWLIVSHHLLPRSTENEPRLDRIDVWRTSKKIFNASWGYRKSQQQKNDNWCFKNGTPLRSSRWCKQAHFLADRALKNLPILKKKDWFKDKFTIHLARLALMLSDHYYSGVDTREKWQDTSYSVYANTKYGVVNQKLDEHNIGVSHYSNVIAKYLPKMQESFPSLLYHKGFKQRSKNPKFKWQDLAYDVACKIKERTFHNGFFGISMASTGSGKTFANAKVMYGLANEKKGCRFSIAHGLRTLTLQTGDAIREKLKLTEDDLAVLIGSQNFSMLHRSHNSSIYGSESYEEAMDEEQYVHYDGYDSCGSFNQWLQRSPRIKKMLSAPILVCTIDHLVPATESARGGRQIAPILRLLTSDLIIDEPDDFGLEDLPALSRLMNFAGLFGTRVILSSATMTPAFIHGLFDAYMEGRKMYQNNVGDNKTPFKIPCLWFDEFGFKQSDHHSIKDFGSAHNEFVMERIKKLKPLPKKRIAKIIDIETGYARTDNCDLHPFTQVILTSIPLLHQEHGYVKPGGCQKISIGLIRFANINPLIKIATEVLQNFNLLDHQIHFCIYHSQHLMCVRSKIENELDLALKRHVPDNLWKVKSIQQSLEKYEDKNHIFIVFGTPVAEVGRDHDYDWAIIEPSSLRSIIQLSGRVARHRDIFPKTPNIYIFSKNYKALDGKKPAFEKPGFETSNLQLISHDLNKILQKEKYEAPSSVSRIQAKIPLQPKEDLADLEHYQIAQTIYGDNPGIKPTEFYSAIWWQHSADWSYELQRMSQFRKSYAEDTYSLVFKEEGQHPEFKKLFENEIKAQQYNFSLLKMEFTHRCNSWFNISYEQLIIDLSKQYVLSLEETCIRFGNVQLKFGESWQYEPIFGFHKKLPVRQ